MSDKMREEFEAWGKKQYEELWSELCGRTKANLFDCYRDGWETGRATLVVELPEEFTETDPETGSEYKTYYSDDVKISITSAGVIYK